MSGSRHREAPVGGSPLVGAVTARRSSQPVTAGRRTTCHVHRRNAMISDSGSVRRLVGIDLGIASDHTVRVLDGQGGEVCRRRARPTVASLAVVETAALAGAPAGTRLEVVMEPTG